MFGCRPSRSVNPYSCDSPNELYTPPDLRRTSGSAASAATARPTIHGVSESLNPNRFASAFFSAASRQFASVTPNFSSIASVRMNPGEIATADTPCRVPSSAMANTSRLSAVSNMSK